MVDRNKRGNATSCHVSSFEDVIDQFCSVCWETKDQSTSTISERKRMAREAQLSQRGRAMLRVSEYFATGH